jgi:hypothetical protein
MKSRAQQEIPDRLVSDLDAAPRGKERRQGENPTQEDGVLETGRPAARLPKKGERESQREAERGDKGDTGPQVVGTGAGGEDAGKCRDRARRERPGKATQYRGGMLDQAGDRRESHAISEYGRNGIREQESECDDRGSLIALAS